MSGGRNTWRVVLLVLPAIHASALPSVLGLLTLFAEVDSSLQICCLFPIEVGNDAVRCSREVRQGSEGKETQRERHLDAADR